MIESVNGTESVWMFYYSKTHLSWLKSSSQITHIPVSFENHTLTHEIYQTQLQNQASPFTLSWKPKKQNNIQKITYKQSGLHLEFDDVFCASTFQNFRKFTTIALP
jgi:hypothetical protein